MKRLNVLSVGLVVISLTIAGCGDITSKKPAVAKAKSGGKEGDHAHGKGPNGGVVFDLGAVHAEFTVDHDRKECTILIIGDDEKTPLAVAAKEMTVSTKESKTKEGKAVPPMTITMVPQTPIDGKTSRFVGADPGLGNVADFEGTVLAEINGQPAEGKFKE